MNVETRMMKHFKYSFTYIGKKEKLNVHKFYFCMKYYVKERFEQFSQNVISSRLLLSKQEIFLF